jgi:hypothetical protein
MGTLRGAPCCPMPADPLAALVATVFDPTVARPSGRLWPVVVGRPRPVVRLRRGRRVGVMRTCLL